jgi:2-keto-4-pentenoate hydratase/2-oxohepta-3-ene-1,7-dioic acid hydratase in catechol pathway
MRLCRFDGGRLGLVRGDGVHDVTRVLERLPPARWPYPRHDVFIEALPSLRGAIEEAAAAAPALPLQQVRLEAPVANPGKIIGAPINYQAHAQQSRADPGIAHGRNVTSIAEWGLFLKAGSSLIGCGRAIELRFPDRRNDHEVELGVVIGRRCERATEADAMQYVAGYTVALDMTLRGTEFQCFRKSIDTYSVLGPWLVTADEVPDPGRLDLWLKVNGELRQQSNTRHLVYGVARLIAFASSFYTLEPGDVIMTGTPEGVGPVRPGDRLQAHVEGVGGFSIDVAPRYREQEEFPPPATPE